MGYLDVEEMLRSMTQRQLAGWQKYWDAEPWGPWRDNMHAAIIAREVRRPHTRRGSKIRLDQFLIRDPEERSRQGMGGLVELLKVAGKPVKRGDYKHDRSRKASRKTGGADRPVHGKARRGRKETPKV